MEGLSDIKPIATSAEPLIKPGTAIHIGPSVSVKGHSALLAFVSVIVGALVGTICILLLMPVSFLSKIGWLAMGAAAGVMFGSVFVERRWAILERKAVREQEEKNRQTFIKYLGRHPEQAEYFAWNERSFLSRGVSGFAIAVSDGMMCIIDRDMMCCIKPEDFVSYQKKDPIFVEKNKNLKIGDGSVLKGGLFIEIANQTKKYWQFTTLDAKSMKRCEVMLNLFAAGITKPLSRNR